MTINWKGEELIKKKNRAVAWGLNETARLAIVHALKNHPGWQYRTGAAEGSITTKEFATPTSHRVLWGSVWGGTQFSTIRVSRKTGRLHTSNYVWYLEFYHGSFLRRAADAIYPKLAKLIKKRFKGTK